MAIETKTAEALHRGLCPEEEAFVSILRTGDGLIRATENVLKDADVLPAQYNVMRILRGSPDGLPCNEIAKRMISRDPDMTRLLDRMEKRGLISRQRATTDRRVVIAKISAEGLAALAALDEPVQKAHRETLGHLGEARLRQLVELLEMARERVG
jgi:DNA-binding MarR family transcriptional regulator